MRILFVSFSFCVILLSAQNVCPVVFLSLLVDAGKEELLAKFELEL